MIDSSGVGRFCGPTGGLFTLGHVGRSLVATRPPLLHESAAGSRTLQLHRVVTPELRGCARLRFVALHYPRLCERSGERLHYAVTDAQGTWVVVLVSAADTWDLRLRDLRQKEPYGLTWSASIASKNGCFFWGSRLAVLSLRTLI